MYNTHQYAFEISQMEFKLSLNILVRKQNRTEHVHQKKHVIFGFSYFALLFKSKINNKYDFKTKILKMPIFER